MSALNTFAPHGPQGSRIDGFPAGVALTIARPTITLALLSALGYAVAVDDTLTSAAVVLREFPWSDDALAHVTGTVTAATLASDAGAFGATWTLDADTTAALRTPNSYALYLDFSTAGAVVLEAGTILGRAVPAQVLTGTLTPSVSPIYLTAA